MLLVAAITLRLTAGVEQIAQKLTGKTRTIIDISSLLVCRIENELLCCARPAKLYVLFAGLVLC